MDPSSQSIIRSTTFSSRSGTSSSPAQHADDVPALEAAGRAASRPRILPHSPQPAGAEATSAGLLRARISEGAVRRAATESRKVARCRKRRRAAQPDRRRRSLCCHSRPAVQAEKPGVVGQSCVSHRDAAEDGSRRARQTSQHHPPGRQPERHPEALRITRLSSPARSSRTPPLTMLRARLPFASR